MNDESELNDPVNELLRLNGTCINTCNNFSGRVPHFNISATIIIHTLSHTVITPSPVLETTNEIRIEKLDEDDTQP